MLYRTYGRTEKKISVVGAGCMRFAQPDDIQKSAAVLLRAHELGINYFDTAPAYFEGKSERILGAAVTSMEPGSFYVSTKSYKSDGGELRKDLETSLDRIGLDRIHFFHIWCVMTPDDWERRKRGGAVEAALNARDEGLVEHVVVSSHMHGGEIAAMVSEGIFEGITMGYNAINFPYREEGVKAAKQAGMGVVAMNPLGGGAIPDNADRFHFIQQTDDPDIVAAAIRFVVSHAGITAALVGFQNEEQVEHAVRAIDKFSPLNDEEIARVKEHIVDAFDELCTGCGYCLPCPSDVPIPKLMDGFNRKILTGSDEVMRERMKWHFQVSADDAAKCVQCGICEERCTQHLPIMRRLSEIVKIG